MNGRAGRASALILALVLFFSAFLAPTSSLSDGSEDGAVYGVVQTFQLPDTLSGFFPGLKHPDRPVHVYPSSLGSAPSYAGLAALSDILRALGISVSVPEVNLPEYSTDLSDIWLGLASEPGVLMDKTRLLLDLRQLINLLLRPPMLIPVTPSFPCWKPVFSPSPAAASRPAWITAAIRPLISGCWTEEAPRWKTLG